MWTKIVNDFKSNPRDIHTVPVVKREPKWFYVFVEEGSLYVEPARSHQPKSNIKKTKIDERKLECMLDLYHRRLKGESVTDKAIKNCGTSVYWYGIFAEMNF